MGAAVAAGVPGAASGVPAGNDPVANARPARLGQWHLCGAPVEPDILGVCSVGLVKGVPERLVLHEQTPQGDATSSGGSAITLLFIR